ncbi:hypothetical protein QNN00_14550 [Bacillus velezensis]|nr:hypothetical protein [Bacillus velezensis]
MGFLYRLYQSNEQFRNTVISVWSQISKTISGAITAIQPAIEAFGQYFNEIAVAVAPEFAKTLDVIVTSLATLKPAFTDLMSAVGNWARHLLNLDRH